MKHKSLLICTIALSALSNAQTIDPIQPQKHVNMGNTGFYENKGQIVDQNNKPNPGVKYLCTGNGLNVQLRQTGFSYDTYTDQAPLNPPKGGNKFSGKLGIPPLEGGEAVRNFHRVDVELVGCNTSAQIIAEDKSEAYYNYFTPGTPQGGVSDVHYYQKVTYKNIYPNIDLVFMSTLTQPCPLGKVEYNFIVHPGGNVADIKLQYNGANSINLTGNKLVVNVASGDFTEAIPSSYLKNSKKQVEVNYIDLTQSSGSKEAGAVFGFSIAKLSSMEWGEDLVIDPVPNLLWGTYYGGAGNDYGYGIALDASDNVYITGGTQSASNIATIGAYQNTYSGGANGNAFIAKFNSSGSALVWGTYYGGTGLDEGFAIALDKNDNVYITGETQSTSGISTAGAYQTAYGGGTYDAFLAKFNNAGTSLLWATYYGQTAWSAGSKMVISSNNNIYISGYTFGVTTNMSTVNAYQTTNLGGNAFVAEFNPTLAGAAQLVWGTFYGSTGGNSIAQGIALDANNNVYITGVTPSTSGIATVGAFNVTGDASDNAFVAKFNPGLSGNAQLVWGTYYGATGEEDYGYGIALDASDNVYITGFTQGGAGMTTAGAYQTVYGGGLFDSFVAKFNPTGTSLLWGSYYGGSGEEEGYNVALDASGNVYISGFTQSANAIATAGAYQTVLGGTEDAYVAMLNPSLVGNAQLVWGTYYGTSGSNAEEDMALDANNAVYITGLTQSTTAVSTAGAYQTIFGGGEDAFVAKIVSCAAAPSQPGAIAGPTSVCNGSINTYKVAPVAGATTYTWVLPGGWTGSSTADSIIATAGVTNGIITVTADNGCGNSTVQSLDVTSCTTGINEVSTLDNEVKLYPNPFSQNVTVDVSVDGPVTITMFNMIGENIGQWQLNKGMNTINTGAIPSGIYLMQIKTANSILNKKLVKAN